MTATPTATPSPKNTTLATVYLDQERVGLMGDPKPLVSKILAAGGKPVEFVRVLRGKSENDKQGTPVSANDVIDRTESPTQAIWLTSKPKSGKDGKEGSTGDLEPAAVAPQGQAFGVLDAPAPEPRGPLPREGDGNESMVREPGQSASSPVKPGQSPGAPTSPSP